MSSLKYFCLFFILAITACNTSKKTVYFQDLPNDTTLVNVITPAREPEIRPGDLLQMKLTTPTGEFADLYNAPPDAEGDTQGFLVDDDGQIELYKLGKVKASGYSTRELKALLEKKFEPYYQENVVSVAIANRHITLLGALSPQVLPLTAKMTLFDALAQSGDIQAAGRTDNVLIIREDERGKQFKRLDLTDKSIFYSPYYYMQPNDIVYVEPVKDKKANTTQIISLVTTGITFTIFLIDRISRL